MDSSLTIGLTWCVGDKEYDISLTNEMSDGVIPLVAVTYRLELCAIDWDRFDANIYKNIKTRKKIQNKLINLFFGKRNAHFIEFTKSCIFDIFFITALCRSNGERCM